MHRFKKIGIIASLVATMTFSMVACSSNNLEEGNETIDTAEASNEASQETSLFLPCNQNSDKYKDTKRTF